MPTTGTSSVNGATVRGRVAAHQPRPGAEADQRGEDDDVEQRGHAAGVDRARRSPRSVSSESPSSGSGGTRLDHTSRPSGFGELRLARGDVAEAPGGGGADASARARRAGRPEARPAAMTPIPASASAPPASCARPRALAEQQRRRAPTVNAACSCSTSEASPAGMPVVHAEEQQPELAGGEEHADGDHVADRHAGAAGRTGGRGRRGRSAAPRTAAAGSAGARRG